MAETSLSAARYLNLETYRRNGAGVRTPVWFAADGPVLYVYTLAASGKAKRIRREPRVRVAPCDAFGRVTGAWAGARAMIVDTAGYRTGMRLLDRKYRPWKQMLDLSVLLFRRRQRIVLAIRLD